MKKALSWILVVAMVFAMIGCSKASETPASEPSEEAQTGEGAGEAKDMKVVALLSGVITDNGWNQICYESVKAISDQYGTELEYIENIAVSDMSGYIRMYGDDGYDMVIVHGSQFESNVVELAEQYPDTMFCLSYGFKVEDGADVNIADIPNMAYVGPINMGIVIGGIMGILTETDKVVFLGGQDIPAITDIVSGIAEGVALTNPDATATTDYLGTLTDQDKGKEVALSYINQGYDVISASANSAQIGCLLAAEERGVYAIGFNGDQYSLAPDAIVLSVMRNYPSIYVDVFESILEGTWQSGMVVYDLADNGTLVSDWHGWDEKLPAEKVEAIETFLDDLYAGNLGDY